jgi:hypothetical protein
MSRTAPTVEEFKTTFPAFSSVGDSEISFALNLSSRLLSVTSWGEYFSDAVGLDTAHNLAMSAVAGKTPKSSFQGAVGPISSVSAAGISTAFNTANIDAENKSDNWYFKTSYGQQFLRLRNIVIPGAVLSC